MATTHPPKPKKAVESSPPTRKGGPRYFHASGELQEWLEEEAEKQNRTVSNLIATLLTQAMEDRKRAEELATEPKTRRAKAS